MIIKPVNTAPVAKSSFHHRMSLLQPRWINGRASITWCSVPGAPGDSPDTEGALAAGLEGHFTHLKLYTSSSVHLKAQMKRITVGKGFRG